MKKLYTNLLTATFLLVSAFTCKTYAQAGAALSFDGANDQVNVPNSTSLNITGNITLEAWVYATKNSGVQNTMCKSSNTQNTGYIFPRTDNGWTNFIVYLHIGGGWKTLSAPYGTLNSWHHLAATWDGTNIRLYKDGVLAATSPNYAGLITSNTNQVTIGSQPGYGEYFGGALDEGRIWNVARTKCEINTYMNCEIPNNMPGLVANYHFNEGVAAASNATATALPDGTSNANNGTLANFALTGATSNWITPGGVTSGSITPLALNVGYTASNPLVCNSGTTSLSGTGANTYAWTGGITDGVAFPISTSTMYTVTGTNTVTSCTNTAVATITVGTTPTLSVNSGTICSGQSFTIMPTGAYSYTIQGGSNVVSPTTYTTYLVQGSDSLGCNSLMDSSIVTVDSLPIISVNSGAICSGASFTMVPSGAASYTFSSGSAVVSPTATSSYSVTGTGSNGCVSGAPAISNLTVNALPAITASTSNTLLCTGQTATLTAGGASTYTWSPGGGGTSISVSPTVTATYTINGTDVNGCKNNTVFTQSVSACTSISELPTANSYLTVYPNPSNGEFTVLVTDLSVRSSIEVCDNLGKVVYQTNLVEEKTFVRTNLAAGIYFIKLIENNKVVSVQKLVNN